MYNQTTTGRAAGAPVAADTEGRSAPAGAALRSSAQPPRLSAASAALRSSLYLRGGTPGGYSGGYRAYLDTIVNFSQHSGSLNFFF